MGGDITYECIGNSQYKLTLKFYRDCNGIPAPVFYNDLEIKYSSASCGVNNLKASFLPVPDSTKIVTPICDNALDRCSNPNGTYGVERHLYEMILDLSAYSGCGDDWVIEWDYCCRNFAITSLMNPGVSEFYLKTTIDNTLSCGQGNNSPTFSNDPVPFGCVNQQISYNHGVFDADGDSLVFSLVQPRGKNGGLIPFSPGYNINNPILTTSGINVNPQTGTLTFTPSAQQVAVVSVLVEEYRNGLKINELVRDVQFTILACQNQNPTLTGFDSTNVFVLNACVGQTVCYNFYSNDADLTDSVFISWNNGIPNASFTTTNGIDQFPVATLCWTPTINDIGPNLFNITVKDNNCDLIGINNYGFKIQVVYSDIADAGEDIEVCSDTILILNGNYPAGSTSASWKKISSNSSVLNINDSTIIVSNLSPGIHLFEYTLNGGTCGFDTDTIQILAYDDLQVVYAGPDQLNVCSPVNEIQLNASTPAIPGSGQWTVAQGTANFIDGNNPNSFATNLAIDQTNLLVWTINNGPCGISSDTVAISFDPACIDDSLFMDTIYVTVPEDSLIQICIDQPYRDSLTIISVSDPGNGTVTIDSTNCFTYVPDTNYNGYDTTTVILCNDDLSFCDTIIVIIDVTPVNDAPIANNDSICTKQDSIAWVNVLLNDSDIDGDELTVSVISDPSFGQYVVDKFEVIYVPDSGVCGLDTIIYEVCDDGNPVLCDTAYIFCQDFV